MDRAHPLNHTVIVLSNMFSMEPLKHFSELKLIFFMNQCYCYSLLLFFISVFRLNVFFLYDIFMVIYLFCICDYSLNLPFFFPPFLLFSFLISIKGQLLFAPTLYIATYPYISIAQPLGQGSRDHFTKESRSFSRKPAKKKSKGKESTHEIIIIIPA